MAPNKKKIKKTAPKTKTPSLATRKGKRGGSVPGAPRACSVCGKSGHNARSHEPGGKLAK
jgi:hypothetical protein